LEALEKLSEETVKPVSDASKFDASVPVVDITEQSKGTAIIITGAKQGH
jgi:hypothetical protein